MKFRKTLALLAAVVMTTGAAACSTPGGTDATESTVESNQAETTESTEAVSSDQTSETADDGAEDEVVVYRQKGSSMPSLSPHQHTFDPVRVSLTYTQGSFYELIYDEEIDNIKYIPAFAEDMPVPNEDQTVWTIKLREGLHFTNGTPIDANTYYYSWQMLLDPVLASPQASGLYTVFPIVNAQAYYMGLSEEDFTALHENPETDWSAVERSETPVSWEDVGIKVIDDLTLEFTLLNSTKDIDVVSTFSAMAALAAVDPDMYEASFNEDRTQNTYGLELDNLAQSGRYIMVEWVKDQYCVYEKNVDYPTADLWTPDVIEEREILDANTELQMFENGELDVMSLTADSYVQYQEDPRVVPTEGPVVWGFYLNGDSPNNPILADSDFRHALFYAVNRESIAKDIYKVYLPANYFISSRAVVGDVFESPQRYRETPQGVANTGENLSYDEALAKELFDKAFAASGSEKVTMELLYSETSDTQKKASEFLKEEYERIFGPENFELVLTAMPTTAAYEKMMAFEHDAGWGTMGQDSWNPWSSMEIWTSNAAEKCETFRNPEFDNLQMRTSRGDLVMDDEARLEALGQMEGMLLDYMPWIPVYQNNGAAIYSDRVALILDHYLLGVAYAPWQSPIEANVERSIVVE